MALTRPWRSDGHWRRFGVAEAGMPNLDGVRVVAGRATNIAALSLLIFALWTRATG